MEFYIDRTHTISGYHGDVTIEFYNDDNQNVQLVFNAWELLKDLPAIFRMASQAHQGEIEWQKKQYRKLASEMQEEFKRPVGRPPKN
jgi:hypothetical protein